MSKKINWMITGGMGFIGTNLVKELLKDKKNNVITLDNWVTKSDHWNGCRTNLYGTVVNKTTCFNTLQNIDVVIHLAALTDVSESILDPEGYIETNVYGTQNLLRSAKKNGVKKFIFASSNAVTGNAIMPVSEKSLVNPISPYGKTKLEGERLCNYFSKDIETVILRFSNVYGPYGEHKNSVVSKFIRSFMAGNEVMIYSNGEQTRDFIHVKDLVRLIKEIVKSPEDMSGEVFQVATGVETTINELTNTIMDKMSEIYGSRNFMIKRTANNREGDILRNYSDINKVKQYTNWRPTVGLEKGIEEVIRKIKV